MVYKVWAGGKSFESRIQAVMRQCSHLMLPVSLLIAACFLAILQPVSAASALCYDPSGTVRNGDIPCYPDAVNSYCCGVGWVCTNASFCIAGPDIALNPGDPEQFEGTCTDKTWNSGACPSFCRTGNLSSNAVNGLWDCGEGDWCCSEYTGDTTCCKRDSNVFFLGDAVNITTIGGSIGPGFSTSTTSSSTSTSPTAASVSASTTGSTAGSTTSSVTSSTSAASLAAVSSTAPTSEPPSSGLGVGAKAAIIVLSILAFILAVAVLCLAWWNRKLVKRSRELVQILGANEGESQKADRVELAGEDQE